MAATKLESIIPDRLYPLPVIKRAAGIGDVAFLKLKQSGLPVYRCGNRAYVRGLDFIETVCRRQEGGE